VKSGIFLVAAMIAVSVAQPAFGQSNAGGSAKTIWDGIYTAAQADRGQQAVQQNCATCHSPADWAHERFISDWAGHSVGELHSQIRTTMPFNSPGKLTPAQYADIVAYMLKINNVPAGQTELPSSDEGLKLIAVTRPASR
jgi:S-disulfanyl-L-cysteine oxidoreductase SoxD